MHGAWKSNFLAFLGNYGRLAEWSTTKQSTKTETIRPIAICKENPLLPYSYVCTYVYAKASLSHSCHILHSAGMNQLIYHVMEQLDAVFADHADQLIC